MRRLSIVLGAMLLLGAGTLSAQELSTGGLMTDKDIMMPNDMFELSQTQFNFGTARSMAMAGAFTSLGADLSSMAINPAGLGMYRRNDISITPMMSFERSVNSADAYGRNSKNRFSIANFGVAFNAFESGEGKVVNVTIGIGYNRIADLNYNYSFSQMGNVGSIGDMYSALFDYKGVKLDDVRGNDRPNWNTFSSQLWAGALGYKIGLTDMTDNGWRPTWIADGADIGHYATVQSEGAIGEYELSMGMNIGNKLYLGATFGLQNVNQTKNYYYSEDYTYGSTPALDYQLLYSHMNQSVDINGVGVNFKVGAIYRPIDNLRIGVAFHTPTYYSIERKYQAAASSLTHANNNVGGFTLDANGNVASEAITPVMEDVGRYSWEFISPARMLIGVSYTFGQRGVISVDYERDWHNGIRAKSTPTNDDAMYNATFRQYFKGSNTLRIGAEYKVLPFVAVRAGYGYNGSMMKSKDMQLSSPAPKEVTYYSAGLGFSLSPNFIIDFAYSYSTTKLTDYNLFYADKGGAVLTESGVYSTKFNRNSAAVSFNFRF